MSIGQGRIIKTYNGYYYVDSGTDELVTCKVKGKLKQIRFSLCTGDIVEFETNHNGESMITRILTRRNFMLRPTIANVDLIIVAFACINPDFSYLLADKLLVLAEQAGIPAVICLNKIDWHRRGWWPRSKLFINGLATRSMRSLRSRESMLAS